MKSETYIKQLYDQTKHEVEFRKLYKREFNSEFRNMHSFLSNYSSDQVQAQLDLLEHILDIER